MPKATKSVSKKPRKNEDSGCRGSPFLKTGSFLSDTSYEVAVKDGPRAGVFGATRLQEGRQFLGHGMSTRARLARNRHRSSRHTFFGRNLPLPRRL